MADILPRVYFPYDISTPKTPWLEFSPKI